MSAEAARVVEQAVERAAAHAEQGSAAELPSLFDLLHRSFPHAPPVVEWLARWQSVWFSVVAILALGALARAGTKRRTLMPAGAQNLLEFIVEKFNAFVCGILGPRGQAHTPFIGTLFLYILAMNLLGLIPLMRSPVARSTPWLVGLPLPMTTVPLAICAIVYVNASALKAAGLRGYLYHMLGSPNHVILWLVSPLILLIHAVGELAKVFSLSMRLFGNISGEDVLVAVIVKQSTALASAMHWPPIIPLHLPFLFLGLLTCFVQAFVFALLTTIYLALMLPHEEHERHEEACVAHAG
ncbi:MAG: F0F1 ATP synthase subunit A [Candidatus Omnitrophica bacterium]|nr:F0F1 ATP synthase subunit A [Candidatus Omnitrophota bacterium]